MGMVTTTVGNKGRVVIPADVRARQGWTEGTTLVVTTDHDGVRLMSAAEALARFRESVAGTPSPVGELVAERHAAAKRGD